MQVLLQLQLHQLDLVPMTVVGSGPASPGMIARSKAKVPVRRQQAPVTVVTSTRLAHAPVVDSGYGPAEIMWWGNLIKCSGEADEEAYKINVRGPGKNTTNRESSAGTLLTHPQWKETARQIGKAIQGEQLK